MANAIPEPRPSQWTEAKTGVLTPTAANWLDLSLLPRVYSSTPIVGRISQTGLTAALGATTLLAAANAGSYQVNVYSQITTVAGVGSTLGACTVTSVYNGQTITQTLAGIATNLLTTILAGVFSVRADAGSIITVAFAYASNPANVMTYDVYAEAITT